jgi:hypothetical protein
VKIELISPVFDRFTMGSAKHTTEKALELLRYLPRVQIGNIRNNPNSRQLNKRGRAQHGEFGMENIGISPGKLLILV